MTRWPSYNCKKASPYVSSRKPRPPCHPPFDFGLHRVQVDHALRCCLLTIGFDPGRLAIRAGRTADGPYSHRQRANKLQPRPRNSRRQRPHSGGDRRLPGRHPPGHGDLSARPSQRSQWLSRTIKEYDTAIRQVLEIHRKVRPGRLVPLLNTHRLQRPGGRLREEG